MRKREQSGGVDSSQSRKQNAAVRAPRGCQRTQEGMEAGLDSRHRQKNDEVRVWRGPGKGVRREPRREVTMEACRRKNESYSIEEGRRRGESK